MRSRPPGRTRPVTRLVVFVVVASCCLAGALGYALVQHERYRESSARAPSVPHTSPASYDGEPRVVFRNTTLDSSNGLLATVPLSDPAAPRSLTDVVCDRVDATATVASCLRTRRGVVTSHEWLELGPDLVPRATRQLQGIPSRTRLSADGRLVASTVFVAGHSYMQVGFSTATVVRRVGGASLGNLERFRLFVDGARVRAADRNVWGVTFAADDDTFYATAATGGRTYLVRGDLSARTLTALRSGAECPSLSPDGRQVAYKVDARPGSATRWRIAVLDLRSGRQRILAGERRSVDDQVAWLDGRTLLYGMPRTREPGVSDVWAMTTDGSHSPRRFLNNAWSPAVIH